MLAQAPKGGSFPFLSIQVQAGSDEDSDLEMTDSQPGTAGLPSPWPSLSKILHLDPEGIQEGNFVIFLKTNTTFKVYTT